jgi:rhodanese-related sulfurtransferase
MDDGWPSPTPLTTVRPCVRTDSDDNNRNGESPVSVVNSITAADAKTHCEHDHAVIVDARPQVMRHQGSLPGAVVVEPTDVRERFTPTPSGTFPVVRDPDTEIAVVSVSSQAPAIAEQIAGLGYTNVHYVDGGYRAMSTQYRT